MKTIIIIFILTAYQLSAQDTTYFDKDWNPAKPGEAAFYNVTVKMGDKWLTTDYYINGTKQMEGMLSNLTNRIMDGEVIFYFPDGAIESRKYFQHGVKTGKHLYYYPDGKLSGEERYVNGKLSDTLFAFYQNGNPMYKNVCSDDALNGHGIYYHENGIVSHEGKFVNNLMSGKWDYWDDEGKYLASELYQRDFTIPECNLKLKFPNDDWHLIIPDTSAKIINYTFKRNPLLNADSVNVIPNVAIILEDVGKLKDVIVYSAKKRLQVPFDVEQVLTGADSLFRINNAVGYKGVFEYNDGSLHNVYVIHAIINGKGVSIFFDITTDLYPKIKEEFLDIMRTIEEYK